MPAKQSAKNNKVKGGKDVKPPIKRSKEELLKQMDEEIEKERDESEDDDSDDDDSDDDTSSDDDDDDDSDDDNDAEDKEQNEQSKGPLFSDENSKWLKPKKKAQLMSSDDEDNEEKEDDDDDGDDEAKGEEELEIERQSRLVDEEIRLEQEEADEEMRRIIAKETSIYHLPTAEELDSEENRVVPPSEIRDRIEAILEVLAEFKSRREEGRSRSEYTDQLVSDLSELYGYLPELMEYFLSMFGPNETLEFVDASDRPRPLVVRTNTLKTRRKDLAAALMKRGVSLDPLAPWSKVGLKIVESPVPVGATPEYLSGHYMLQSAASMCPVLALSPQPKEKILDMSAAPGGKTSYICQLMRNTGVVIANDLKAERQKATVANMHRLGVKNCITCKHDGRKLGQKFPNSFDRILLDAPCSGLGVISRDPSVKVQRTIMEVQRCAHLQKELLLAAIDALNHKSKKSGGVMVYSTCSVSVYENEEVINYALQKRDIKLLDTGLDFGKPGFTRYQNKRFHPSVALTRRFYPHVHNMDGFYVAKIEKISDRKPEDTIEKLDETDSKGDGVEAGKEKEEREGEEDEDEDEVVVSKKKRGKKGGKKNAKKIARAEAQEPAKKKAKKDKLSIPPSVQQPKPKKKKKMNAKVTKPRRRKAEATE